MCFFRFLQIPINKDISYSECTRYQDSTVVIVTGNHTQISCFVLLLGWCTHSIIVQSSHKSDEDVVGDNEL